MVPEFIGPKTESKLKYIYIEKVPKKIYTQQYCDIILGYISYPPHHITVTLEYTTPNFFLPASPHSQPPPCHHPCDMKRRMWWWHLPLHNSVRVVFLPLVQSRMSPHISNTLCDFVVIQYSIKFTKNRFFSSVDMIVCAIFGVLCL